MNKRQQYLHDNMLHLAYKVGPEAAVLEINQTRAAAQAPADMVEAVRAFEQTWEAIRIKV